MPPVGGREVPQPDGGPAPQDALVDVYFQVEALNDKRKGKTGKQQEVQRIQTGGRRKRA